MHNIFIVIHGSFLLQSPEDKCHRGLNLLRKPKVIAFFSSSGRINLQQRFLAVFIINRVFINNLLFLTVRIKRVTPPITKSFTQKINVQNVRKIPNRFTH